MIASGSSHSHIVIAVISVLCIETAGCAPTSFKPSNPFKYTGTLPTAAQTDPCQDTTKSHYSHGDATYGLYEVYGRKRYPIPIKSANSRWEVDKDTAA